MVNGEGGRHQTTMPPVSRSLTLGSPLGRRGPSQGRFWRRWHYTPRESSGLGVGWRCMGASSGIEPVVGLQVGCEACFGVGEAQGAEDGAGPGGEVWGGPQLAIAKGHGDGLEFLGSSDGF